MRTSKKLGHFKSKTKRIFSIERPSFVLKMKRFCHGKPTSTRMVEPTYDSALVVMCQHGTCLPGA